MSPAPFDAFACSIARSMDVLGDPMATRPDHAAPDPEDVAPVPDDLAPALRTWIPAGQKGDAALAANVLAEDAVLYAGATVDGVTMEGAQFLDLDAAGTSPT